MAFSGQVQDDPHAAFQRRLNLLAVGDVAIHEPVARMSFQIGEVGEIAGVSQRIEIDDCPIGLGLEEVAYKVAADEAAAAGEENGGGHKRDFSTPTASYVKAQGEALGISHDSVWSPNGVPRNGLSSVAPLGACNDRRSHPGRCPGL